MAQFSRKKSKRNPSLFLSIIGVPILFVVALLLSVFSTVHTSNQAGAACATASPTTAAAYQQLIRGPVNGKYYRGDLGRSVKLPDGKVLWVFGDTMISTTGASRSTNGVNNAALLVDKGCITALTGPLDSNRIETSWIKPTALTDVPNVNDYYWSNTAFMDGSTLRMFLSHMYNDASGFHGIGVDLATFNIVNGIPVLSSIVKTPGSANGTSSPSWGAGVYRGSSYTYIFGNVYTNTPWVWGHDYYLARVPNGSITTPSKWTYWNGKSWVTNQAGAVIVIPGTAGVGSGITVNKNSKGQYVIITKKFDIVGSDMVAFTADALTGPWTEKTPALLAPVPPLVPPMSTGDFTYFGFGHPEVSLSSGKQLVSWSLGSSALSAFGDLRNGVYFSEVPQP